ncbi:MAG TPA: NHLP bacteriocin system secretion protein [Thermoanaerobaculia bacterium]
MIFRKVALERLSSPEQLDQLLQVTDAKGWLALIAAATLLATALGWGIFGSVPTEAAGTGILIRQGGVSDLVSAGSGQVAEVLVRVGDTLKKGDIVAHIRQEALLRQIRDTRAKLADQRSAYQEMLRSAEEQKRLGKRDLEQQRANLERSIAALVKNVALLEERVAAEDKLLQDGLITKQAALTTQQSLNTARDQLASQRLEANGLELKRLTSEQQLDQQLETRRTTIQDLEIQLHEANAKLSEDVAVVSPFAGRVLEQMVDRGDVINPGTPILSVEVQSEELMAVLFVPASAGKQVQAGMPARISPSTVKKEEYGYMVGRVTWVAAFPSTTRGMVRLLGNEALVTKLMQEGPPIQVNVALAAGARTPSGYRWSSSTGPPGKISSGTLADGSVVVRQDRPLSLVLPTLREKLGV